MENFKVDSGMMRERESDSALGMTGKRFTIAPRSRKTYTTTEEANANPAMVAARATSSRRSSSRHMRHATRQPPATRKGACPLSWAHVQQNHVDKRALAASDATTSRGKAMAASWEKGM